MKYTKKLYLKKLPMNDIFYIFTYIYIFLTLKCNIILIKFNLH